MIIVKRTFEKPSTLEVIIAGVVSVSLLVEVQDVGISSGVGSKDDPVSEFNWGIDQTFKLTQPTATLVFSKLENGEIYCKAL